MTEIKTDRITIYFGKYKGKKLNALPDEYLAWLYKDWERDSDYLNKAALQELKNRGVDPEKAYKAGAKKLKRRGTRVQNMDDEVWSGDIKSDFLGNTIMRTIRDDWDGNDPDGMYDYEGIPNFD